MSFAQYYQAELGYLREMGRAFGESHPAIAGMLVERGGDPDVQRLIEGFAFLTARLRQRIEQAVPQLLESLTELVLPQFVEPIPSATMVEFQPPAKLLRGRQRVAAGAELAARARSGTSCRFRTSEELELVPATIVRQRLDDAHPSRPRIVLDLQIAKGGHEAVFAGPLRLHLHGEYATTSQLYLWLARHLRSATLHAGGQTLLLPRGAVRARGFETALWPWPTFAPAALGLLTEYFTFPSKFLFVEANAPNEARSLTDEIVQLVLEFDRPLRLASAFPPHTFRLHCVPAVNLFEVGADPIRWDALTRPQLLRASGVDPAHMEVHSVRSVTGVLPSGARCAYQPFTGFRHNWDHTESYYVLTRELSPVDDGLHHFLSIATPRDATSPTPLQTLSVELTCTNRSLPNELGVGDLCLATSSSPIGIPFQNIGRPSRPVRPPLGSMLYPRLLAHLSSSRRSLMDVGALRTLLSLYNLQTAADHPVGRVNQARIDALDALGERPCTRVVAGAPVRGTAVTVSAREDGFVSKGDAFLFGSVLDRVFGMQVQVNTFSELELRLLPSNDTLGWAPRWQS